MEFPAVIELGEFACRKYTRILWISEHSLGVIEALIEESIDNFQSISEDLIEAPNRSWEFKCSLCPREASDDSRWAFLRFLLGILSPSAWSQSLLLLSLGGLVKHMQCKKMRCAC